MTSEAMGLIENFSFKWIIHEALRCRVADEHEKNGQEGEASDTQPLPLLQECLVEDIRRINGNDDNFISSELIAEGVVIEANRIAFVEHCLGGGVDAEATDLDCEKPYKYERDNQNRDSLPA